MRTPDDRRERLLAVVNERGTVPLRELAEVLAVSLVTVRRDVESLNNAGLLVRQHGSVSSLERFSRGKAPGASSPYVAMTLGSASPYLGPVAQAARRRAYELGMRFVLHLVPDDQVAEAVGRFQADDGCAGVLVAPHWTRDESLARAEELLTGPRPVVLVERQPALEHPLAGLDQVGCDHARGVFLAVDHLRSLGHGRLALTARADSPTARAVRSAFGRLVGEEHARDAVWVSPRDEAASPGALADFARWVTENDVTGVVAHNDWAAIQVHQALRDLGRDVPGDVSLIAYDDVVAELSTTALTAVAPPVREIGYTAVDVLRRRSQDREAPVRHVRLAPRLVVRGSTGPRR